MAAISLAIAAVACALCLGLAASRRADDALELVQRDVHLDDAGARGPARLEANSSEAIPRCPWPCWGWASVQQPKLSHFAKQGVSGFRKWELTRVDEQPLVLPKMRLRPPCNISRLTGACLPAFMVIGVQKSGTSTIYGILRTHPQIQEPIRKELLWFNGDDREDVDRCRHPSKRPSDKQFATYLRLFPRAPRNPESPVLSGEFSATNFHCYCCPEAFKRLMPGLRLVVSLRDPIERAMSRWTEQLNLSAVETWRNTPYRSFVALVDAELPPLQACLTNDTSAPGKDVQCAARSNILGMSLYDSAFKLWHKHWAPGDLLVTYIDHLAVDPQSVMSAIHRHLGVSDQQYDNELVHRSFNHKGDYGWLHFTRETGMEGPDRAAMEKLYHFYRPHMQALQTMAKDGLITPLPAAWVARWDL